MPSAELPAPLLAFAEYMIEQALRMDEDTAAKLHALNERVVQFDVTPPGFKVTVSFVDGSVQLLRGFDGAVDTTLRGSLPALLSLRNGNDALYDKRVSVEGDVGLTQQLRGILDLVDLDIEEWLSPWLGDGLARKSTVVADRTRDWAQHRSQRAREDLHDYLMDEVRLTAHATEVDRFNTAVDELRQASDRLAARLERLSITDSVDR